VLTEGNRVLHGAFERLEPHAGKLARAVLRGRGGSNVALLPDALPLDDDGFDHTVLCEFRARLIAGEAELRLFETVLTCLKAHGFVKARGRQRTDSTHVLAAIHVLNRLECVGETLRHTLNVLAVAAPAWLRGWVPPVWFERYAQRLQDYRLPKGKDEREALAAQIGADGRQLLARLDDPATPAGLGHLPAVRVLRQVWLQQYYAEEPACWRAAIDLPPGAVLISSPYDAEARFSGPSGKFTRPSARERDLLDGQHASVCASPTQRDADGHSNSSSLHEPPPLSPPNSQNVALLRPMIAKSSTMARSSSDTSHTSAETGTPSADAPGKRAAHRSRDGH
jgi:hypothetical protein